EMPWLNDPGMHRPDRHLKDPFAFHFAELMPHTGKGRQLRAQIKILSQRMNLRPVVVHHAATRVGVAQQFYAEEVLNFSLLPVDSMDGVGERGDLGLVFWDGDAYEHKAVRQIERVKVIDKKTLV